MLPVTTPSSELETSKLYSDFLLAHTLDSAGTHQILLFPPQKCHLNHYFLHFPCISFISYLILWIPPILVFLPFIPYIQCLPHCTRNTLIINTFELLIPLINIRFWSPIACSAWSEFYEAYPNLTTSCRFHHFSSPQTLFYC